VAEVTKPPKYTGQRKQTEVERALAQQWEVKRLERVKALQEEFERLERAIASQEEFERLERAIASQKELDLLERATALQKELEWEEYRSSLPAVALDPSSPERRLDMQEDPIDKLAAKVADRITEQQAAKDDAAARRTVEVRIRFIEKLARNKGLEPTYLPHGAKTELKEECLKQKPKLFTESTFTKAWTAAGPRLRMADHQTYARRYR